MPTLREELCDCEIGDIAFENLHRAHENCYRVVAMKMPQPPCCWDVSKSDVFELPPRLEFERALATLPDSTAKVRVWKRVS